MERILQATCQRLSGSEHALEGFLVTLELSKVEALAIRARMVSHLLNIDEGLAESVANGLRIRELPAAADAARPTRRDLARSPCSSIVSMAPRASPVESGSADHGRERWRLDRCRATARRSAFGSLRCRRATAVDGRGRAAHELTRSPGVRRRCRRASEVHRLHARCTSMPGARGAAEGMVMLDEAEGAWTEFVARCRRLRVWSGSSACCDLARARL